MILLLGCSDFMPVQTARINGDDAAPGSSTVNGCTADMYVDRSAAGAARTVGFGGESGSTGFTFAPKCIAVAVGQDVTFSGAFATHPLNPGVPGNTSAGSAGNPIPNTISGTTVTVHFPTAGTFPYACGMHGFLGMNGAVLVR